MKNSLDQNLMSMGWYMRRTANSHTLGDFYTDVVKLPLLRGGRPWPVTMYWSGEATVFELKSDEEPMPERDRDPLTAPCTPIFRVHGLDALVERLVAGGAKRVGEDLVTDTFRQAHLLDTDDQILALRETPKGKGSRIDDEAWRRYEMGCDFDPQCGEMPDDIQCLDGILMRVEDLPALRKFYRDVIGFEEVTSDEAHVVFDLGDNTFLELRGGGHTVPVPKDRVEITNSFILRLQDTERFKAATKAQGVHFVNEHIQWKRAHLAYFADPEGRIVGVEQRYDPENYLEPVEVYAEDTESERRFAEGRDST